MNLEEVKEKILPVPLRNGVTKAGVFGSLFTSEYGKDSDVDFLVEMGKSRSLLDLIQLKLDLEDALNIPVDLVEYFSAKSAYQGLRLG